MKISNENKIAFADELQALLAGIGSVGKNRAARVSGGVDGGIAPPVKPEPISAELIGLEDFNAAAIDEAALASNRGQAAARIDTVSD